MNSLRDLMRNFLPANKYNDAIALLGQLVRSNECDESEEENEVEETVTDNVGGTTKRKRKEGNDDLSEKDELKNMKVPIEKLNYIFELHKVVVDESRVSCFTNAARVYYNQRIVCIVNCVENHFNGNKQNFLNLHSEALMKKHSKFYKSFCKGKGSSCSP